MTNTAAPRNALVALSLVLATSCSGGNRSTAPSTAGPSIAGPTTSASLPAAIDEAGEVTEVSMPSPTTVTGSTTSPDLGVTDDAAGEVAQAEVLETLDLFWVEVHGCFAQPDACDIDDILATYTDGYEPVVEWLRTWADELERTGRWIADSDKIEYELRQIETFSPETVMTTQCIVDNSRIVEQVGSATSIVDGETGYAYFRFGWSMIEGRWRIAAGSLERIIPGTTNPCGF